MLRGIALAIILIRALLSNVVMFDAHAPDGSFGLVICSGHGPMFPIASPMNESIANRPTYAKLGSADIGEMGNMAMDAMPMSSPSPSDTSASHTSSVSTISSDLHGTMDMADSQQDSDAICAFSAVLFAALVTAVVRLILCVLAVRRTRFRQGRSPIVAAVTLYRLALSRAPPPFALAY